MLRVFVSIQKLRTPMFALLIAVLLTVPAALTFADYNVRLLADSAIEVSADGSEPVRFEPEFTVLFSDQQITQRRFKLPLPIYDVTAWQIRGQREPIVNLFEAARGEEVRAEAVEERDGVIYWRFPENPRFHLTAEVRLSADKREPQVHFNFTAKEDGFYSIGYTGAPERAPDDVEATWQPLAWHGKRFPEESYLTLEYNCSIPGTLATASGTTYGVIADPDPLPFRIPTYRNNLFGVAVRNRAGNAQPMVFAPVLGADGSRMQAGHSFQFDLLLLARTGNWEDTFEYVAREIMGFSDYRENVQTSLNETLENMVNYGLGEYSRFLADERGSSYATDMPGAVKNVSALHPLSAALVLDDEEIFKERFVPLVEYMLSREKFLFSSTGEVGSQTATSNMRGPSVAVSELAELHSLSRGKNPIFLHHVRNLYDKDRTLNMTTVTYGSTWQRDLSLYRATQEQRYLDDAVRKATRYIDERLGSPPSDFSETGTGTFWENILPAWPQLFELFEETGERRFLEAAVQGARQHASIIWFYPKIPDTKITANKGGKAPLYRAGEAIEVPEEDLPAWRVSEIGLIAEGLGTAGGGHRGIFLTTYAPYFLRMAQHSGDQFLRDIARAAVVGRYSNFPGYHMNRKYSTVHESPDFPLRPHEDLTSTSMHYNHVWVQIPMILDYLVSDAFDRSNAAIDFPSRFVEGYAYLYGKAYGDRPGRFYNDENVWLWMPRGILEADNVQANYLTAMGNGNFYAALMNESDREIEVSVQINRQILPEVAGKTHAVRIWNANEPMPAGELADGQIRLRILPKSITAFAVDGLSPRPRIRNQLEDDNPSPESFAVANSPIGTLQGMYIGNLTGTILSFGAEAWAYGYLEGDFQDLAQMEDVTFHYRTGDDWNEFVDRQYPWEFRVPLVNGDREVEFYITTRTPQSEQELSERVILRR